jgi:hypothetical protein
MGDCNVATVADAELADLSKQETAFPLTFDL